MKYISKVRNIGIRNLSKPNVLGLTFMFKIDRFSEYIQVKLTKIFSCKNIKLMTSTTSRDQETKWSPN